MKGEERRILNTMRYMAWERAKGELNSMLQTYWRTSDDTHYYKRMEKAISEFIDDVEGNGLQE